MNTNDGCIFEMRPGEAIGRYGRDVVEVRRPLTLKEKSDKQIKMYSPCGCGSGKKFRFCCHKRG